MRSLNKLLIIGFILVVIGSVLPFLIVIEIIESTFLLNLIAYLASIIGIFLGVIGTAHYVGKQKQSEDYWRQ